MIRIEALSRRLLREIALFIACWFAVPVCPAFRPPNFDAKSIPAYTLENPLVFADGRKVTVENWSERRKEILEIFAREMYGVEPPAPQGLVTVLVDEKVGTVAGFAIRRQYRMWFRADRTGPSVNWILWLPRYATGPVPVILFLNYRGNQELVEDADLPLMSAWSRNGKYVKNHRAIESARGLMQRTDQSTQFPIGMILARGYAVMSACYCEVSPDPDREETTPAYRAEPFAYTGVFGLWGKRDESRTDNITSPRRLGVDPFERA